jgi:uncharacterized protein (UPF0332 family)
MKEYASKLLDKALDAIEAAEGLTNMGKAEIAAGRAYYAMFYVAEALLNEKGLQFGRHGDVIGAYGKHFSKTKVLDQKFHRWLIEGFDTRMVGDAAGGGNYQTLINNTLREHIVREQEPIEVILRRVVREELHSVAQ